MLLLQWKGNFMENVFTRRELRKIFNSPKRADLIASKPQLIIDLIGTNQALLELRLRGNHELIKNFSSEKRKFKKAIARLNFTIAFINQYEKIIKFLDLDVNELDEEFGDNGANVAGEDNKVEKN